ncbi:MAG TPA: STAS domain-containing protein [Solirubrobacteraceae bacterium]
MRDQQAPGATTVLGDVAIVAISGELDLALCVKVAPDLNAALRSPARAIVIDLEAVSLMDSSGVALLLNAFRRLDQAGRRLAIALPLGSQRRALEVTALDRQLPIYETRADAFAAVRAG